jgi:hypothetical protein
VPVSQNPDFQNALSGVLAGIGKSLHANANDAAAVKAIADDLVQNAPAIVSAVVSRWRDGPSSSGVTPYANIRMDPA